nr:hypothetical protein [Marinobacter salexigens]
MLENYGSAGAMDSTASFPSYTREQIRVVFSEGKNLLFHAARLEFVVMVSSHQHRLPVTTMMLIIGDDLIKHFNQAVHCAVSDPACISKGSVANQISSMWIVATVRAERPRTDQIARPAIPPQSGHRRGESRCGWRDAFPQLEALLQEP